MTLLSFTHGTRQGIALFVGPSLRINVGAWLPDPVRPWQPAHPFWMYRSAPSLAVPFPGGSSFPVGLIEISQARISSSPGARPTGQCGRPGIGIDMPVVVVRHVVAVHYLDTPQVLDLMNPFKARNNPAAGTLVEDGAVRHSCRRQQGSHPSLSKAASSKIPSLPPHLPPRSRRRHSGGLLP